MNKIVTSVLFFKNILITFLLAFISTQLSAQSITNYTFAASTGIFTALSTPTATTWTGTTDEGGSALIPIGFDFWYMGVRYTGVAASTNGWLALGVTQTDYLYTNALSTAGTPRPVIAPLWDDLDIVATTNVTYKTTGTAGSRIFTVQYLNVKWNYLATGSVSSFQVNFYESTGKIEFVYRSDATAASAPSASIGITATTTGSGSFLSVNNAGTGVSSTSETSITTKRVSGRTYGFTPPVPIAPGSLTYTSVTGTDMTLNWTDLSSNERGFVIYRSTDNVNFSFASQTAAAATSSVQSGLTGGTTYYWKVYAVTEGGLSTALSGNHATSCSGPNISQLPATNLIAYYKFEGNATDATANDNGTLQGAPAQTADRYGNANKAYAFNGTTQYISTANSYINPSPFSVSIWFKTTTVVGGALIGFSSMQTGTGGNRDRFIYMTSTGTLFFGVAPGAVKKYISTTVAYNDGNWHMASGTVGAGGLKLYVDGNLVVSDATVIISETTTGYWRVGHSDLATWPSASTSYFFEGTLDDAIIYHKELSSTEINTLYSSPDGAGSNAPVCAGSALNLTATTASGATYSWTGPNSFTSSAQNPGFSYTAAAAGIYTVQVTVAGCAIISTAYTKVASTTIAGQWTGNVSSDWANANNWCDGILPSSSVNVTIPASATTMPSIVSNVSCKDLTINVGASITTTSAGTLNIAGTLTNNGTITNSGTTNFNGTSGQQAFSGVSSFYNLTLNNTNGLLLPAAITVNNNLTLTAGTLNANNFNVTVKGNWTNNVATTAFTAGTATATFNGTAGQTIGGSFATTFNNLTIADSGSIVTLNLNTSITGNLTVSSGTLDLSAFTLNRASAGGALTVANNATLKIGGNTAFPANFTTNTLVVASTVEYSASGLGQNIANQVYGNLKLTSTGGSSIKKFPLTPILIVGNLTSTIGAGTSVSFSAAADITVNGNVSIGASTTFSGSTFSINIGGNWVNNGTFTGGTSTVTLTGAGTAVSGSGTQNFNNLTVAASSITFSNSALTLTGNLATTGSGSFSQASGGTLTMSGASKTISGTDISLDNLTISGSVTTAISLNLTGNLSVSGSFTSSAGTITMSGASKTMTGAGTRSFSSLSVTGSITANANFSISSGLVVSGNLTASAGTATFTGTATLSGTANLFNTTINGTSLQLSANSVLGIANAMTITAGILDVTASIPNTVNFNGTSAQNINAITYSNLIFSNGNSKTALAGITVNNDITVATGTTFVAGAFTHSIYDNWSNYGSFTAGTSTIQFLGTATTEILGNTTFNVLTINNTTAATQIILKSNISAATVNMINGILKTGTNTLTITNTRTGNGKILGNIQRTHTFTTGTPYAFESPYNTITFSSVSSVTSVTISVTEGQISDFPFGSSISEEYNVTVPAGTYNATLRLDYESDELNGNNESSLALWHYNGSAWMAVGKTANNTDTNYVEQSGLTNITGRWTLSDAANLVQWNGSVSTDWHTAANWTVVQGAPSRPPSATDIVDLGTASFTNQPTISDSALAKNIHFGSTQAVTLTLASGGSLTTTGNIDGDWSANATHTINVNNQNLVVNGDLNLSDGVNGQSINFNINSGTVHILGSLLESGNASVNFSGTGALNIHKDFDYVSGSFSAGNGTVTYMGNENQDVANLTYNNLTINKAAGLAAINDTVDILGNLLVTSGELDNTSTTNITGNVSIASGATLYNYAILRVGGNWGNSGNYNTNGTGTNVVFNGTGTQTIAATTFNNLEIKKPVGSLAVLTGDVTLTGDLAGTSGTLDIKSFFFNRTIVGGSATIGDSATLIIAADNAPNKFSSYFLAPNSTVIFNGTGTQHLLLPGLVYGNLIFRDTGTKILYTAITVNGNLTIESGSFFDGSSRTITLNGNWINAGTFTPSTSTVVFAGIAKSILGNTTFNKVIVSGTDTILSNVSFNGLLNITSTGNFRAGGTILVTMNGDLINSGILYTLGTTTFSGNVLQTLSLINAVQTVALTVNFNGSVSPVLNSTSAPQYGFLNINNTGGVNPSVGWTIAYSFTVGSGASFNGGISTHNILGSVANSGTLTSSGTLNFIPSSAATINLGSSFSSTGTVMFGGAAALTLAGTPTTFYNVQISNTNVACITPTSGWNISNNFTITSGANFNAGSYTDSVGGNLMNNGTLNSGTSTFVLKGSANQGISSGSAFNNLTLNKPAGVATLLVNATINGALSFLSGNISTGGNQVILPATGSVTGAAQNTGWVSGNLKKNIATGATTKNYEIGSAISYTPIAIVFSNVSVAGDLMASTVSSDHPNISSSRINPTKSVNRYWTLTNNGVSFNNYAATCNFKAADVDAGASTSSFGVSLYNNSSWTLPAVAALNSTSTQATGVTAFGDFAIGEVCNAGTAIAYTSSPYCSNAGTALVGLSGTSGGVFGSSGGLTIDSTTGAITLATSIAGAYDIIYTVAAAGGCPVYTTTTSVTITAAPSATIAYMDSIYCHNGGKAVVTFTGTTGGVYTSDSALTINATNGDITLSTSTSGTHTVTYTISTLGGCATYTTTASITITAPGTWTGNMSTDWNTDGNWLCGTAPVATTNIIIPDSRPNYPIIISGTNPVNNLTIANSAALTVNGGSLLIAGSINNSGTFTAGNGSIEMNGASAQTIPAATFVGNRIKNLTINNSAGVTLDSTLQLLGILKVTLGQFNAGGYLTLISTDTQTALIDGSGAGEVLGNVTMQRYLANGFGYKYFSSPFLAATVNELSDDVDLGASFPTVYRYDENQASSGWINYTNTTDTLLPMQGYAVNVDTSTAAKTIDITGVVKNHTITAPTLYNHNQPYTQGFNLMGNPYPSPIDWDIAGGWSRANIDNGVYYFNAGTANRYTGTYSSYINGISSDGVAGNIIAAMQGFFVHVSSGTFPVAATLTINNNARINNLDPAFHKSTAAAVPLLRLSAGYADDRIIADPAVVYFNDKATRAFDPEMDALKLMNSDSLVPNLYIVSPDAADLSICAWPTLTDSTDIIPLGLQTKRAGWITFKAPDIERIPAGNHIYLQDAATGISQDIQDNLKYRLYLDVGKYERRFSLALRIGSSTANSGIINAYSKDGKLYVHIAQMPGEQCDVVVVNILGQVIIRKQLKGNGDHELGSQFNSGVYIVSFSAQQQVFSQKVFIGN